MKDNKYVYNLYKYNVDIERGIVDNATVLDPEDDAAFVLWGDNWRMPTMDEADALLYNKNHELSIETVNEVNCFCIKNNDGTSLLLPYSGLRNNNYYFDNYCRYWLAEIVVDDAKEPYSQNGRIIDIYEKDNQYYRIFYGIERCLGLPIRPVYHEYQKITGIILNKSTVTLSNGSSVTLTASVNEDAYYKRVNWISNNENVVTVSKDGKITAVSPGTATIIAKAKDRSGKNATCTVTVTA